MTEVALIGADIQEVIGSAIAIKILSNGHLSLWAGVLITAFDCFIFLFLENYGVRKFEAFFAVLIGTMALSFAWMFGEAKPDGKELLLGVLVPKLSSRTIRQAVGLVGCVIMPHNVFLHSALVHSRKIEIHQKGRVQEALNYYSIESTVALAISFMINLFVIWHTGIVVYGSEYFFGGGIQRSPIGRTPYGTPIHVVDLGVTHLPKEVFEEYLSEISPRYTAETYNLLTHNCNNFTNELAQFLAVVTIPDYILQLPNEVMNSPTGALLLPMMQKPGNIRGCQKQSAGRDIQ